MTGSALQIALFSLACSWILLTPGCVSPEKSDDLTLQDALNSQTNPIRKPFLWRVHNGEKSCFMLGTLHHGIGFKKDLPGAVWRAFDSANSFVTEHDLRLIQDGLINHQTESGVDPLNQSLSETAWKNLREALPDLTESQIAKLSPGKAAFHFQYAVLLSLLPPKLPRMDLELFEAAHHKEVEMVFLESIDAAAEALHETVSSVSELEAMLVRDQEELRKELVEDFKSLLAAYRSGDLKRIEDETMEQTTTRMYDALIAKRNHAWIGALELQLTKANCFIAVGVGHMVGPDSLLGLLQERGFVVERIDP